MKKKSTSVPFGLETQHGQGVVGNLLLIPVVFLLLALGFFEGRKLYWDYRAREMCEKDGGVKIFDQVRLKKSDIDILGRIDGKISVPSKDLASAKSAVFSVDQVFILNESYPKVWRQVTEIIRRSDERVVARSITYSRVGGDFPSPAHSSSFACPDASEIVSERERLFIIEGDKK